MKIIKIRSLLKLLILSIFTLINIISCTAMEEYKMKEIDRQFQQTKKEDEWWEKYIRHPVYVGMTETEFVNLFERKEANGDTDRPHIINKKGNSYIVVGLDGKEKYRFTFADGLLLKYEQFGLGQNPFGYSDSSFLLRGFEADGPGFYSAMTEDEFLQTFSGSILSHSKDYYIVTGKNGRKYKIKFKNGYLIGMETIR